MMPVIVHTSPFPVQVFIVPLQKLILSYPKKIFQEQEVIIIAHVAATSYIYLLLRGTFELNLELCIISF